MKNLIKTLVATVSLAMFATSALATQYQINATGLFTKDANVPVVFGSSDPTLPVNISILIDTDFGTPVVIPAGTVINPGDAIERHFDVDLTFIPMSAVKTSGTTIGTGNWTAADMYSSSLFGHEYGVLITGTLTNENVGTVSVFNYTEASEMYTGDLVCNATLCHLNDTGIAYEAQLQAFGNLSNVVATVTEVNNLSTDEMLNQLEDMVTQLQTKLAVKIVLKAEIKVAQKALKKDKLTVFNAAFNVFNHIVENQKGKTLTIEDAQALQDAVQDILDSI